MGQEQYQGEQVCQPDEAQEAVENMLACALKPLAKLMLGHRMPVQTLERVAHKVFVDVAEKEFGLPGRKQSTSRIALLTGLTRKAVKSLRGDSGSDFQGSTKRWNRASAVITGWTTDPMFKTDSGESRELRIRGKGLSFETLVKRYGGDMPVVTVLNELKDSGNVETINAETVRLIKVRHVAAVGSIDALRYAAKASQRLGDSLEHNILADDAEELFAQHEFWSNAVPEELLPEFREKLQQLLREMAEKADAFIGEKETLPVRSNHWVSGIGYYYFEEPPEEPQN